MVTQCDKQFNPVLLFFENCINTSAARGNTFHDGHAKSVRACERSNLARTVQIKAPGKAALAKAIK
jgi:hypothetical protein